MIMMNMIKSYILSAIEIYGKILVSQDVRY